MTKNPAAAEPILSDNSIHNDKNAHSMTAAAKMQGNPGFNCIDAVVFISFLLFLFCANDIISARSTNTVNTHKKCRK